MKVMQSPTQAFRTIYGKIRGEWKVAFLACLITGLIVHMPVLLSDIPNHDGLDSMYFDQNMITSGRWFLTVACGISSYYTLPWVIGLLGLLYLSCGAAVICEILEVRKKWAAGVCGGLLAAFPALASTFAYVFTLDGYMLALLLAVLSVLLTKKYRTGFLPGALCLAFSMGIYQGYLSFAMLLSIFAILMLFASKEEAGGAFGKMRTSLRYLWMGIVGAALYYGILQVLLKLQGKKLADYQGIGEMTSGAASVGGFFSTIKEMYLDFFRFSLKGNVLFQNFFSVTACILLAITAGLAVLFLFRKRKDWKNPLFFAIIGLAVAVLPLLTNIVLLISPSVTYHLLMRYQWILYVIGAVALVSGSCDDSNFCIWMEWTAFLGAFVLTFCYCITDNIAYSNLQKRYEKTYAYCIRLLDRIEQTEGYYAGIPVAMVGVVGDESFPATDITLPVTYNMIGMNGDVLLYTGKNYEIFIRNYLGATLNILPPEAMEEVYYSQEYIAMDSFPGENSIRIIDDVMYVKTENVNR
ncbi:glucosyltransferase domain-containing protein [Acetatifactor muris]|uniref:glucosyltransferase domain-containing protein n=1 Tax=Acetatifactor muris TaxID=879566 RepID=UPI0023F207AC|nr:glucosyltransferase domain-containing protein [Acetatifactor muris]